MPKYIKVVRSDNDNDSKFFEVQAIDDDDDDDDDVMTVICTHGGWVGFLKDNVIYACKLMRVTDIVIKCEKVIPYKSESDYNKAYKFEYRM